MTNPNRDEIIILLDRSGSMQSIRNDMEGAIKTFLDEQRYDTARDCRVTFIQFDYSHFSNSSGYKVEFISKPLNQVGNITFTPRGNTALNDSIVRAIDETGDRFSSMEEKDRPAFVYFMIITDGLENDSRKFSASDVKNRIDHQTNKYKWEFRYLGANQDAISVGKNIGVDYSRSATYKTSSRGIRGMSVGLSNDYKFTRSSAIGEKTDGVCRTLQSLIDEEEEK